eukprot:6012698-Pleurochrysis_carterae.AAC.1
MEYLQLQSGAYPVLRGYIPRAKKCTYPAPQKQLGRVHIVCVDSDLKFTSSSTAMVLLLRVSSFYY